MSLTRFRARNHPQQLAKRSESLFPELADPTDDVDDRWTPPELWNALHERFQFTVDAAASHSNAKLPRYWTKEQDGTAQDWSGERVWCNPPFSDIAPWVRKASETPDALVVILVPANRTEQGWWQEYVEPNRDRGWRLTVEFLAGRTKFVLPRGEYAEKGNTPPFGCCLLIWQPQEIVSVP